MIAFVGIEPMLAQSEKVSEIHTKACGKKSLNLKVHSMTAQGFAGPGAI